MGVLSSEEIERRLPSAPGWTRTAAGITRQFTFATFPEAVAFVNRLVPGAEDADHHPDITINYRRVTLVYTTHSEGGVTEKDFAGAARANAQA
jgi:4a-hydroxytetrahydrobiopterin dehydratase